MSIRGNAEPPGTCPLSKGDVMPLPASVRSSTMRCWLVGPASTIWYVPNLVSHFTFTTANSRRVGVVALFKGTSANVPPTGHSRLGQRHGGKHPSTQFESLSVYGVMSAAATGLERMSITVSKHTMPFTDTVMSISGNDEPPGTSPLSNTRGSSSPTFSFSVICCCTATSPPTRYVPDPVIRVSTPPSVSTQLTFSTRYHVNSGSWWSKASLYVPRMSSVVKSGHRHGGKHPRVNDEPDSSRYSTGFAVTCASARAPASTSMSTTSTRTMALLRVIIADLRSVVSARESSGVHNLPPGHERSMRTKIEPDGLPMSVFCSEWGCPGGGPRRRRAGSRPCDVCAGGACGPFIVGDVRETPGCSARESVADLVQVLPRLRQVGLQLERLLVVGDRLFDLPAIRVHVGQVVVRLRELRIDLQRALVVRLGLLEVAAGSGDVPQVVQRIREIWPQPCRPLKLLGGLDHFSLLEEQQAEGVVGLRVPGVNLHAPLVERPGLVRPSHGERSVSAAVIRLGQIRLQREAPIEVRDGLGGTSIGEQQVAQVDLGHPRGRILGQGIAPEPLQVSEHVRSAPRCRPEHDQEHAAPDGGQRSGGPVGQPPGPGRRHGDEERDQAEAGEILEVVGDEGEAEGIDVDEAERGSEGDREVEYRRQRTPPDPSPQRPEHACDGDRRQGEEPLPPRGRIDLPARVDEGEPEWNESLGRVEPQCAPGEDAAVGEGQRPLRTLRPHLMRLDQHRPEPAHEAHEEEGGQSCHVEAVDPPPLQPEEDEDCRGQRAGYRLAEHRQNERQEGERVESHRSPVKREAKICEQRDQIEEARLDVLELRDPGDRFHVYRVEREHGCRHPRSRDREAAKHEPDEARIERMQQNVDEMVAERVHAPEVILRPEHGLQQRIVLGWGRREPDCPQTIHRLQRSIGGHPHLVVPDESAPEGRNGGCHGQADDRSETEEPAPSHRGGIDSRGGPRH